MMQGTMYALRLVQASEGYRRIAWLALAVVAIWRAGYFYKGYKGTFFAWYGWLEWRSRWLDDTGEILLYIVMTLVEVAAVMAALVVVINSVGWVCRGFNPEFHNELPELPAEFKAKFLKIGSRVLGWLSAGPVGYVILVLLANSRRDWIDGEVMVILVALVLASIIGWIIAGLMSKKAQELNKERAGNEQHGPQRR